MYVWIKDRTTGNIHEFGTEEYDSIAVRIDGGICYIDSREQTLEANEKYELCNSFGEPVSEDRLKFDGTYRAENELDSFRVGDPLGRFGQSLAEIIGDEKKRKKFMELCHKKKEEIRDGKETQPGFSTDRNALIGKKIARLHRLSGMSAETFAAKLNEAASGNGLKLPSEEYNAELVAAHEDGLVENTYPFCKAASIVFGVSVDSIVSDH